MVAYALYVYSPDDFVGGLPDESGAQAAGTPTFTLTLKPTAEPTLIWVEDNDLIFDEIDSSQALSQAVTIDENSYAANTTINTAYDLRNTTTGHKVTSFHFGGDGYQQGPVDGIVSTVELLPGQSYSFNRERTSHQKNNPYSDYVACFVAGTLIETPTGAKPVETLNPGDLVCTHDGPAQRLCWVGQTEVTGIGPLAPVRLPKGWNGLRRDLYVSPQHRMLVDGPKCELMTANPSGLTPAIHLVDSGLAEIAPRARVTYCHIMCENHEIVLAEGVPSESLLVTDRSLAGFSEEVAAEIRQLFPSLTSRQMVPAHPILKAYQTTAILA